jgi:uncharacterized protein DUF2786
MEDKYRVVEALLAKTVARGATPHEAASARAKAEKMIAKHGLDRARIGVAPRSKHRTADPFAEWADELQQRHAQELRRRLDAYLRAAAEREMSRRRGPPEAPWRTKEYTGVGDMAREQLGAKVDVRERGVLVAQSVGLPYREILKRIRVRFPDATTTVNSLRWYEAQLRRAGKSVPKRWGQHGRGPAPTGGKPR